MRRVAALAAVLLAGAAVLVPGPASADRPAQSGGVTIALSRQRIAAAPGEHLEFSSTVTNTVGAARSGLVAHLSILSSDPGVYVDPEDWSPKRTQYLSTLGAGDSTRLTWRVQAVTSGPLLLYVSVTDPRTASVTTSSALEMQVGGQRRLVAAEVLPLVVWAPATVLVLLVATGLRKRRHL